MSEFRVIFREPIPNRVFIADDDPVMRHLLTAAVKQQHCEVVIASDGREAYRILQADAKFRAVILDISMPSRRLGSCPLHEIRKTVDENSDNDHNC